MNSVIPLEHSAQSGPLKKKSETLSAANKMSTRRKRQAPPPPPLALEVVTRTRPLALPPHPSPQSLNYHIVLTNSEVEEEKTTSRNSSPTSHDSGIPSDSESNLTSNIEEDKDSAPGGSRASIVSDR